MPLKREQPLFFKKLPVTDRSPANAQFCRYVDVVNGEQVIEIVHASEKWLVKESEVLDVNSALVIRAKKLHELIESKKEKDQSKSALAEALGICGTTFRRWCRLIATYLPKAQAASTPTNPTEAA